MTARPTRARCIINGIIAGMAVFLLCFVLLFVLRPSVVRAQDGPVEWLNKTYPDQAGYCCDHEHCQPVLPGQLVFDGQVWRLRNQAGGLFRGAVEPGRRYWMPLALGRQPWACVYQGEFRCLLLPESGQ